MHVDPETYIVTADGEELRCEPMSVLPLAQRYFLFYVNHRGHGEHREDCLAL